MAQTTTSNASTTNASTNGSTNAASKREPKPITAVDAIGKISKILDQLTPIDQKRVLAFINASNERSE